jgi:uncharacterized protein YndB with AHSA1/START domain
MTMAQPQANDSHVLHLTRTFEAPRERLFRAWTDPEWLAKWWGPKGFTTPSCALDARPGGAYRFVMRSPEGKESIVSGVYEEITPPRRLVFTWGWDHNEEREHETRVTVELFEVPGGTRLDLTHEPFATEEARNMHSGGWNGCLDSLQEALAAGALA